MTMKILEKFGKSFDAIMFIMMIIAGVLLVGLVVIVGSDITLRSFFNKPQGWVKEVSEYILVYLCFLVPAWILRDEGHVKMDMVINALKPRAQCVLNIITTIMSALICIIMAWFSLTVTVNLYQTKYFTPTVLEMPKFIFIAVIFIGYLMLTLQLIRRAYGFIGLWKQLGEQEHV
jgi:C4-dicarboxylate transporter DctQ subunit